MMPIPKSSSPPPTPPPAEPDWADLCFFLAVAETGSLTKAAQRLRTTQPTVSKHLDDLEQRLGVTLVTRSLSGVTLTDAGRLAASHAATISRSVRALTQSVSQRDRAPAGTVSIVCPDAMATYVLAPALSGFQRAFPGIKLVVRNKPDPNAPADLTIQFRETKRMDDVAIALGWLHYAGFASKPYLDLYPAPTSLTDAFQHKVLVYADYMEQTERWGEKVKSLSDMVDPVMTTDCGMFLVRAVTSGAGVAALPTYVARFEPELVMLSTDEMARLRFWLVFDRENGERTRMREAIEWIKGVFNPKLNPWFSEEFIVPEDFAAILAR